MSDSTQHSKKLRVAATLHDESGQSPFWATVVLYEDLRAAAVCRGATSRESEELARRLVACWNACDTVSTEFLEQLAAMPVNAIASYEALKAQRDELLAGLERIANPIPYEQANVPEGYTLDGHALLAQVSKPLYYQTVARALIAKHKEASHG